MDKHVVKGWVNVIFLVYPYLPVGKFLSIFYSKVVGEIRTVIDFSDFRGINSSGFVVGKTEGEVFVHMHTLFFGTDEGEEACLQKEEKCKDKYGLF